MKVVTAKVAKAAGGPQGPGTPIAVGLGPARGPEFARVGPLDQPGEVPARRTASAAWYHLRCAARMQASITFF